LHARKTARFARENQSGNADITQVTSHCPIYVRANARRTVAVRRKLA
jgi:hypothetical protein